MDILASILAYMTCVAGIIGAFAISIMVLFATPDRASTPRANSALMAKAAVAVMSTPTSNIQTAAVTKRVAPSQAASEVPVRPPSLEKRKPSRQISAAQLRQLARQERDRHLAYQQDPDFEARFLGYAD